MCIHGMSNTAKHMGDAKKKCQYSIGVRSGCRASHSILSTPKFWSYSVMILALWGKRVVFREDGIRSKFLEIWDYHWPQILILISHYIEMTLMTTSFPYVSIQYLRCRPASVHRTLIHHRTRRNPRFLGSAISAVDTSANGPGSEGQSL